MKSYINCGYSALKKSEEMILAVVDVEHSTNAASFPGANTFQSFDKQEARRESPGSARISAGARPRLISSRRFS